MKEHFKIFTDFFGEVPDEDLAMLASMFRPVAVSKMNHLYSEGDNVTKLYFVSRGTLRGYYCKDGEEHTCNFFFGPCMVTDLFSVRQDITTQMNLQALKDSDCYEADFLAVEQLAFVRPDLLRVFYKMYEFMFSNSIARQISFIYDSPKERYLNIFKERPNIIADIPQHYIASYLGIKPETLSRIRKKIF